MGEHTHAVPPTGVKLEPQLKSRLKELGKLKHRTIHWLMKEAIQQYLEQEEEREKLKHETMTRWEEEAEKNMTVSNGAVMAWLDTWGTENEKGRPKCGS